ncbi:MAG: hypothetical protein WCX88_04300 [Patescibacteria group bacterium]
MAKKLFIGNLDFTINQDQLKEMFAVYGPVLSANIVIDKFSGRSKGFGFVEFENDEDAMKALAELNDSEQMGRNIAVKEAISREEQPIQPPIEKVTEEIEPVVEETLPEGNTEEPIEESVEKPIV